MSRTLVIMPCHNEQGRVGPVVSGVLKAIPHADVAVIDDCSSDQSADEARLAGAIVLPLRCQLGYGGALETGYLFALRSGYDTVVQMDSDGQHPPEEAFHLLQAMDTTGADVVMGSRHLGAGTAAATSTPWVRHLGHWVFSAAVRMTTGRAFSDPTSGFRALNQRALNLLASGWFPCNYPDSDVLMVLVKSGMKIEETPVRMLAREGGTSMHSGLKPLYYSIHMALAMFVVLLNRRHWRQWKEQNTKRGDISPCST